MKKAKPFDKRPQLDSTRINRRITARQVFLINETGEKVGVVPIDEALYLADIVKMDLVEVSGKEFPPVCKIMDYGKYRFNMQKNQARIRKEQKLKEIKELQVRPNIEEHDLQVKLKQLKSFIEDGLKVQIILKFKGRQIVHPEIGLDVLRKFAISSAEIAKVETEPKIEGKKAIMIMVPIKDVGKSEA